MKTQLYTSSSMLSGSITNKFAQIGITMWRLSMKIFLRTRCTTSTFLLDLVLLECNMMAFLLCTIAVKHSLTTPMEMVTPSNQRYAHNVH